MDSSPVELGGFSALAGVGSAGEDERNWTGDTCALLASAGQQVGLQLGEL